MLPATISWLAAFTVCPAPDGPTCTIVLPTGPKTSAAASKSAAVAADHDGQRGVLGAGLAAGHRGVQDPESPLLRLLRQLGGDIGADGGEVDDQRAGLGVVEHAPVAGQYLTDMGRVGHHHGDDVGLTDRVGDRAAPFPPAAMSSSILAWLRLYADDVEPGGHQMAGHRAAHDAQADESNGGH